MAFQRGAHIVGHHLEAAADDRLVGASQDPQEAVFVDAGHVGRAHPVRRRSQLTRLDLEQARLIGAERVAVVVDHPQLGAGIGAPHAAPFGRPVLLVIGQRPAGHAATEFGCGVGGQDGDAEFLAGRRRRPRRKVARCPM